MKVFIVFLWDYESYQVYGLFDSQYKANECRNKLNKEYGEDMATVESWEVK